MPKIQQKMRIILAHSFIMDALLCCMQMVMPHLSQGRGLSETAVLLSVFQMYLPLLYSTLVALSRTS